MEMALFRSAAARSSPRTSIGVHREPRRFYLPAYIGARGWFGLRLDRGRIDWREVAELIARSWSLAAPKTLARARAAARAQNQP